MTHATTIGEAIANAVGRLHYDGLLSADHQQEAQDYISEDIYAVLFSGKVRPLTWVEELDENDNSSWVACSAFADDGSPFMWRLRQRLVSNRVEWYAAHDEDICSKDDLFAIWSDLNSAKISVQERHDEALAESREEDRALLA